MIETDRNSINNFTVAVRIRPNSQEQQFLTSIHNKQNQNNQKKSAKEIKYKINQETLQICGSLTSNSSYSMAYGDHKNKKFKFDRVFESQSNTVIFKETVQPKLDILKDNYNVTILTYGVTGSGKTYTVFGKNTEIQNNTIHKEEGIALLSFNHLLSKPSQNSLHGIKYSFSYMQIYNEQVHDLLIESSENETKFKSLAVLQDSQGTVHIPELSRIPITNVKQIRELIKKGNSFRACSSNLINKMSSRSHALLQLNILDSHRGISNSLTVIDLAGSQKIPAKSHSFQEEKHNKLQKQGSNINRSLLSLGNCIKCLQQNKQSHIPYRDSKLTRILKSDLSGYAHNIMIACIGREASQFQETLNTLQYAGRAKKICIQTKAIKTKNFDHYNCESCGDSSKWEVILGKIPNRYSNHINRNISSNSQNSDFQINSSISSTMNKFKKQVIQIILNEVEVLLDRSSTQYHNKTSQDNLLSNRSAYSNLFSQTGYQDNQFSSQKEVLGSNNSLCYKLQAGLRLGLADIFNFYEGEIREIISQNLSSKDLKINNKFIQPKYPKNQLVKHVSQKEQINYWSQINKPSNIHQDDKKQIQKKDNQQFQTRSRNKSERGFKSFPKLTLPCLREQSQNLVKIKQNKDCDNLIKMKIECPTANTTGIWNSSNQQLSNLRLQHLEQYTDYSGQYIWKNSHHMNPDVESDDENATTTKKQLLFQKLANAQKKNENERLKWWKNQQQNQIQVSCFSAQLV